MHELEEFLAKAVVLEVLVVVDYLEAVKIHIQAEEDLEVLMPDLHLHEENLHLQHIYIYISTWLTTYFYPTLHTFSWMSM